MSYTIPGFLEEGVEPILESRSQSGSDGLLPGIIAVPIVLTIVYVFAVILRIYSRLTFAKKLGLDDYWIMVAVLWALPTSSMIIYLGSLKYGTSGALFSGSLNIEELMIASKLYYILQILLPLTLGCVKMSILTFYLKLSPTKSFQRLVQGSMILVGCVTIASCLMWTLSCLPIHLHWDLMAIVTGTFKDHCRPLLNILYACMGLNMMTDILVWVLPIPMILKMQMVSKKEKAMIVGIMSGGFIACLASIGRLVQTYQGSHIIIQDISKTPTDILTGMLSFTIVEVCLGITSSCLPALKPLLLRSFPRIFKSANRRSRISDPDFPTNGDKFGDDPNDSRKIDSSTSSKDTINLSVMKSNEKHLPRGILKGSSSNSTMNSTAFTDTMHDIDIEAAHSGSTITQSSNPFAPVEIASPSSSSDNVVPSKAKNVVTIILPVSERPRVRPRQGSMWSSFQSTISRKLSFDRENIHDKEGEGDLEPMQSVNETNEQQKHVEEEDWNLSVNDFCIDPNLEHAVPYDVFNEADAQGDISKVRRREVNPLISFLREEGKKSTPKNRFSMGHKYPLPGDNEGDDIDEIRAIDEDEDDDEDDEEEELASSVVQHQDSHGESYAGREVWRGDRLSI